MKKTTIIIILVIIACVFLSGCKKTEETVAPTSPTTPVEEPVVAPTSEPSPSIPSVSGVVLSDLRCVGNNIQGIITNVLNQEKSLEDIRVLFNGVVVDPATLNCDKTALKPGESTLCESLQGIRPLKTTNVVAVSIGTETEKEVISC